MKKLLLLSCLVLAGLVTVSAQGLKGKWYGTAQLGYSETKTGDAKTSGYNVLPIVGTFVSPDATIGLAFGCINSTVKEGDVKKSNLNLFAVEPLARKYWNISGPFFFFGQLAIPILSGKDGETDWKYSQFGLGASAGFDIVIWKNVSIEFSYNIANLSLTTINPGEGLDKVKITNLQLAHIANDAAGIEQVGLLTPLSFGIKFFLN